MFACALLLIFFLRGVASAEDVPAGPVVDGHLGHCSASFTVRDIEKKPVYNAQIDVTVRYGLLGLHKLELQVGTNSDGKGRVAGLPEKVKKPLEFHITSGRLSKTVSSDPSDKCEATFEVTLGSQ